MEKYLTEQDVNDNELIEYDYEEEIHTGNDELFGTALDEKAETVFTEYEREHPETDSEDKELEELEMEMEERISLNEGITLLAEHKTPVILAFAIMVIFIVLMVLQILGFVPKLIIRILSLVFLIGTVIFYVVTKK